MKREPTVEYVVQARLKLQTSYDETVWPEKASAIRYARGHYSSDYRVSVLKRTTTVEETTVIDRVRT